ncbi:MAG: DUF504 domain-containing protein [Bacteroidia bacterium]|nr:DUF504 domain-containing protein [Bacteroidia bacterium]
MKAKPTLRSIKDVHSRLKWDGGIPTESIFIGYIDRMRGLVEMPFSDFTPGGRVPWDRIQYFRLAELRIWDRETRIDMIFGSGDTPPNLIIEFKAEEGIVGSGWQRIPALQFDALAGNWEASNAQPLAASTWNTLTVNLLSNHFLFERVPGTQRYQQLLDLLSTMEADVITLQEADREFLELLGKQPWVQRNYCVIDNRHIAQERSHFEIVLTKVVPQIALAPIIEEECRSILLAFEHKGNRFWVLNVHLFSDSGANAPAKREAYLSSLLAQLPPDDAVLLQGDFNFGDEYQSPTLAEFTDFWLQLHPGDPGITYDGSHNPMSKKVIPNARDRRLDRMMVRTETGFPLAEMIEIVHLKDTTTGEYLSDHYGVQAKLSFGGSFGSLRRAPKTHHSALTLLPPASVWHEIQALRRQYDSTFSRWMPHINLLYGFIPQPYFAEAAVVLQNALSGFASFELTLEGFDSFEHADSTTIYLRPDADSIRKLREIQQISRDLFPNCDEQNRHGDWNPHLTVAKIPHSRKREAKQLLTEWNSLWTPVSFEVNVLSLIARAGNRAFEVHETVFLGKMPSDSEKSRVLPSIFDQFGKQKVALETTLGGMGLLPSKWLSKRRKSIIQRLEKAASKLGKPNILLPVGSLALGTLLPDSDLDFLCMSHMPQADFFTDFQRNAEGLTLARVAANALVPTLRLEFEDMEADIMYLELTSKQPLKHPEHWSDLEIASLSTTQLRIFNAFQDFQIVEGIVSAWQDKFHIAAIALKTWADLNDIHGNAFGYPGGFAWTLMLAQAEIHASAESWLSTFFEWFLRQDWSANSPNGEPMFLTSGAPGGLNITRNVSTGTLATLRVHAEEALLKIWEIWDGQLTWNDFFALPAPLFSATIQLEWQARNSEELEHVNGWMQSQIIGLLKNLEALPFLTPRPSSGFVRSAALQRQYRIGLRQLPQEAEIEQIDALLEQFEKAFHEMPNRPASAKLKSKITFENLVSEGNHDIESHD